MATPSEVFRDNLRRLARIYDLDASGLAAALQFTREDKKWLARVWDSGLARNDRRSKDRLRQLATFYGLDDPGQMWIPDVEPNPEQLARTLDHGRVWFTEDGTLTLEPPDDPVEKVMNVEGRIHPNPNQRWVALVEKIANVKRVIDRLWARYPHHMFSLTQLYDDENEMIAFWVAAKYGNHKLTKEEDDIVASLEKDFGTAIELEISTNVVDQVRKRLCQHPGWFDMIERILRTHEIEESELGRWWRRPFERARAHAEEHGETPPELPIPQGVFTYIDKRIAECMIRRVTPDEIYARFVGRYLDTEDHDDNSEMLFSIHAELETHPMWDKYVETIYDWNEDAAKADVREKWTKAREQSNHTVSVNQFVHAYRSHALDDLIPRDDTVPGDLGNPPKRDEE
jgi:hypothetical protein